MDWDSSLLLLLGLLVAFMGCGLPVVFAFFLVNVVGAIVFLGGEPGLVQMVRNSQVSVAQFALIPIPLFVFMGEILYRTGLAARAIDAVDRLIAKVPGRLALVAIASGTIFSSLSGSTIANAAMLGGTLLPEMYRRGYHPKVSIGPILAVGGVAMLIPPSALAVLLGSIAKIPIGDLLIAGTVPGVMMAALFSGYVVIRCWLDPKLAPAYPVQAMNFRERYLPFLVNVVPLMTIFIVVVGSIVGGIATPSESAALGSVASLAAAAAYQRLTWANLVQSVRETVKVTTMILFIICASITFSQILAFSGATQGMSRLILDAGLGPGAVLVGMLLILLFLGCFMDQVSMMMITLPLFMPVAIAAGFDLVWFGILMLIALEIGLLTPPFGLLLFVMKSVAPAGTTMQEIIESSFPFIGLEILVLGLLCLSPSLVTWLPELIR